MDRLDAMHVFSRIVTLGSFTKAADELQLPRATVTHAVQQLEARLGVRLLQRTTRHVSPTIDGHAYFSHCQQILHDVEEIEAELSPTSLPHGKLRVNLQGTQALHFILPRLGEFHLKYPDIELEIGLDDRFIDLVREGIDCVLRTTVDSKDSSLVSRRIALLNQITCASQTYLQRRGIPRTLEDFREHDAVNYVSANGKTLPFEFQINGDEHLLHLSGPISVSSVYAYTACCLAGMGFVQVPRYHIETYLRSGVLVEVFPDWAPSPLPVSVMYPNSRHLSSRVRVFIDWLAECMSVVNQPNSPR